jgi:hypothetical protein
VLQPLVAALVAIAPLPPCAAPAVPAAVATDSSLVTLFDRGQPYAEFLAEVKARRELWTTLSTTSTVPADALATVAGLSADLRVLVVAIDSCSDSANTIPLAAALVATLPSVRLRIVKPDVGDAVMARFRTPDGRAATPTIVVLDAAGNVAGCWVERPSVRQQMAVDARAAGTLDEYARTKQAWYDADGGRSTYRELAAVLHGAATGAPICSATATK